MNGPALHACSVLWKWPSLSQRLPLASRDLRQKLPPRLGQCPPRFLGQMFLEMWELRELAKTGFYGILHWPQQRRGFPPRFRIVEQYQSLDNRTPAQWTLAWLTTSEQQPCGQVFPKAQTRVSSLKTVLLPYQHLCKF